MTNSISNELLDAVLAIPLAPIAVQWYSEEGKAGPLQLRILGKEEVLVRGFTTEDEVDAYCDQYDAAHPDNSGFMVTETDYLYIRTQRERKQGDL